MSKTILLSGLLVATVALSGCADGGAYETADFDELSLARGEGDGFCPDKGMAIAATLKKGADGRFILSGTRAVEGDPLQDACSQREVIGFSCMVEQAFGPIAITEQQIAALRARVEAVPAKECVLDKNLACDPCLVTMVEVDGHLETGDCCGKMASGFSAAFERLVAEIDGLAALSR